MRRIVPVLFAVFSFALLAGSARAGTLVPINGTLPNGIVREADGTYWVAEEYQNKLTQLNADGSPKKTLAVPDNGFTGLVSLANGPDGKLYVSSSKGVFAVDTSLPDGTTLPTPAYIKPGVNAKCTGATAGIVNAGSVIVYTGVDGSDGNGCNVIGVYDPSDKSNTSFAMQGDAYYVAYADGKIYTADFYDGVVERFGLSGHTLTHEGTWDVGDSPSSIAVGGGNVYAPLRNSSAVAKIPANAASGQGFVKLSAPFKLGATEGSLFGADGNFYFAVSDEDSNPQKGSLIRMSPDGSSWNQTFAPTKGQPFQIAPGANAEELWVSDRGARVLRYVSGKPQASTSDPAPIATGGETLNGSVDPRGNDTSVKFEYGPTTAYGSSADAGTKTGVGAQSVTAAVTTGLVPGATYHYHVVATNELGTVSGEDKVFTTPAADNDHDGFASNVDCNDADASIHPGAVDTPGDGVDQDCSGADAAYPKLTADTTTTTQITSGKKTASLLKFVLGGLTGGETIKLSCSGGAKLGCPFKKTITVKVKKKGSLVLTKYVKKGKFRKGAKLTLKITKEGFVTKTITYSFKGKAPVKTTTCQAPNAKKAGKCV